MTFTCNVNDKASDGNTILQRIWFCKSLGAVQLLQAPGVDLNLASLQH